MLILSISADTFPLSLSLSFSLSLSSSSFFLIFPSFPFSHLAKRKQPVLNTSAQVQGGGRADPIYQLVRLDTFNFHAPSILTLFQIFKTVLDRPGQWFLAKSRGVFAKLNFFSSFSLSLSLSVSLLSFFFFVPPDYTDACSVPRQAPNCLAMATRLLLALFFFSSYSVLRFSVRS